MFRPDHDYQRCLVCHEPVERADWADIMRVHFSSIDGMPIHRSHCIECALHNLVKVWQQSIVYVGHQCELCDHYAKTGAW
jgi:hypothetical protein